MMQMILFLLVQIIIQKMIGLVLDRIYFFWLRLQGRKSYYS